VRPVPEAAAGQSYSFDVAFVSGPNRDSVAAGMARAASLERGVWTNLYPDTSASLIGELTVGKSGFTGHETCYEAPPGSRSASTRTAGRSSPSTAVPGVPGAGRPRAQHGDAARHVPVGGRRLRRVHGVQRQRDARALGRPGRRAATPAYRAVAGDRSVRVEWTTRPRCSCARRPAGDRGAGDVHGYNVYRLSDWRRKQLLPGPESFQLIASFA